MNPRCTIIKASIVYHIKRSTIDNNLCLLARCSRSYIWYFRIRLFAFIQAKRSTINLYLWASIITTSNRSPIPWASCNHSAIDLHLCITPGAASNSSPIQRIYVNFSTCNMDLSRWNILLINRRTRTNCCSLPPVFLYLSSNSSTIDLYFLYTFLKRSTDCRCKRSPWKLSRNRSSIDDDRTRIRFRSASYRCSTVIFSLTYHLYRTVCIWLTIYGNLCLLSHTNPRRSFWFRFLNLNLILSFQIHEHAGTTVNLNWRCILCCGFWCLEMDAFYNQLHILRCGCIDF